MSTTAARQIYTNPKSREIPDLLQSIFAAELLAPSRCLWLVSPWLSDIPILDNTVDGFTALSPDWPRDWITLAQILGHLAASGTTIRVATRPAAHNRDFEEALKNFASPRIFVSQAQELHAKGILGDTFFLSGSMNFTLNGITVFEEIVHFLTDPVSVSEARLQLESRWGGAR